MKAASLRFALLAIAVAGPPWRVATLSAEEGPSLIPKWEYRVLTKEQLLDLGKKNLAEGLNVVGGEGWELAVVDGAYIFKRLKDLIPQQRENLRGQIALIESEVTSWKERVAWAERMAKKGFMTDRQVEAERTRLKRAETALERLRREFNSFPADVKEPVEKERKPDK